MSSFAKKSSLALAFLAVTLATGCAPRTDSTAQATNTAPATSHCTITEKYDGGSYYVNRVIDFDTDVVIHKMGYGESGITTTPFSQLSPRAQQKMETLRKTLPANCQ